ncbi:MAG: YdcF family protein [Sphingomonadales bacterium]
MRWLIRLIAFVPLLWALGFAAFVIFLPGPADINIRTDAIVVPTGGPGRIARGIEVLAAKRATRMFISGADRSTSAASIARVGSFDKRLFACCVDVGHEASNTRANAEETSDWLKGRKARSLRLVTTDWHMPRAWFELERVIGSDVRIVTDAVESDADLSVLVREYNKYLLRRVAALGGL